MTHFKGLALLLLVAALVTTAACSLSDIRPAKLVQEGVTPTSTQKGRALLAQLAVKHGTLERWRKMKVTQAVITDRWPSLFVAKAAAPWPDPEQRFLHTMLTGQDNSRLEYLGGEEDGRVIGIQNWATYHHDDAGQPVFEENANTRFWLPTVQYFVEAPFRLNEAEVVTWVGQEELNGRTYSKVFLSWGTEKPQGAVDQYIAWIDQKTGLLGFLEFTVRDIAPFVISTMAFEGYHEVQGFQVPTVMRLLDKPGGVDGVHAMRVSQVRFNVDLPESSLIPDPDKFDAKNP